ncbi:MAG: SDR family NAD(P)-dependent oxidoreductase [Acidimicrobiales bacterium]
MNLKQKADSVIEVPVVTSFTSLGYDLRRRLFDWASTSSYDLTGNMIVLTGATSGLGKAAAMQLANCGASLVLVGRTAERNEAAVADVAHATGNTSISQVPADMGDLEQVRQLARAVLEQNDRIDVLIHNAGALSATRQLAPDGTEATVASQVVGPFLLTALLLDRLAESRPSRVLTMSSGGMYAANLTVSQLQMPLESYKGTEQYARAKRAQVTLNELLAQRFGDRGVHFQALHPGWADTPGVDESLPIFSKVLGPVLRSPQEGADTLVWLAADDAATESNGLFWHDRRARSIHKLPTTKRSDTPERRRRLWDWVAETAELPDGWDDA